MRSALTLPRLLVSPITLWNLGVIGVVCAMAARILFEVRFGFDPALATPAARETLVAAMLVFVLPTALGGLVAWSAFDFLLCPLAPTLPGARRGIARGLVLFGLAAAVATAAAAAAVDEAPAHASKLVVFLGLALLTYGVAVLSADPVRPGRRALGTLVSVVVVLEVAFADRIVQGALALPWALGPVAGLAGLGLVLAPLRAAPSRARALLSHDEIGASYRALDYRLPYASPLDGRSDDARASSIERVRTEADWARSTVHELTGHMRGGWVAAMAVQALLWSAIVVGTCFLAGLERSGSDGGLLFRAYRALDDPGPGRPVAMLVLATWAAMFTTLAPFVSCSGFFHPLSRRQRAGVAWRTALGANLTALGSIALLLTLVAALLRRLAGFGGWSPPGILAVALVLAVLLPLGQWARLRFLDASLERPTPAVVGLVAGSVSISFLLLTWGVLAAAEAARLDVHPALLLSAGLAAFAVSQLAWRSVLAAHFRGRDLV